VTGPIAAGLDPLLPDRFRLGALVRALSRHLADDAVRSVRLDAGHLLEVRGRLVLIDGREVRLGPAGLAVLRRLTGAPGEVVGREALLAVLPGGGDDLHAVDVAVSRLRRNLPRPGIVQTVVKRGYRLAVTP
jgi:uroporphyrinogen-III synthase